MKNKQRFDLKDCNTANSLSSDYLFRPRVYHMSSDLDIAEFKTFIDSNYSHLNVHNNIEGQLKELLKIDNPKRKLSSNELDNLYQDWIQGKDLDYYGTWVYYPWNNNLVHLLEETDFIRLRTSRNQYKITPEEQSDLGGKKVGVIGLSVGQSVALTMAMERVFGTLRIADFDHLDLSNLNRIRSGVANIGLPKTIIVAREIAEIDPFLKIELYPDGITDENLDEFLGEGESKLDLLVEECDSLDIKIKARIKARAKSIPVIMDTSDRGMMDIERFDLDNTLPIMHGMVDEGRANQIDQWTAKERLALVMDMVGAENISSRLKASLLEVEETLTTWPQLASSVVLGGAISTVVVRQILLRQAVKSGRYYLDVDDKYKVQPAATKERFAETERPAELSFSDCKKILSETALAMPADAKVIDEGIAADLVEHACLAPSGGNVQAWKWIYQDGMMALFHDMHFSHSFLDFKHRGSFIGFGAAVENLNQRAAYHGLELIELKSPEYLGEKLLAVYSFKEQPAAAKSSFYFGDKLTLRLTNRKKAADYRAIDAKVKAEIENELEGTAFRIAWIEDREKLRSLAQIVGKVERQRILDPWGHSDFIAEARWTAEAAESTRNGVDLRTLDLNEADKVGFKLIRDAKAIESLRNWDRGSALIKMSADAIENSSLCLLYTMDHSPKAVFEGGQWVEKLWLYFNANGIAYQPVSPATFMFARLAEDDSSTSPYLRENLKNLRQEYLQILGLPEGLNDLFLSRLFYAEEPKVKSLRKPLTAVYKNFNTN